MKDFLKSLASESPLSVTPRLVLVLFLINILGRGQVLGTFEMALAASGIFLPALARTPWFWGLLVTLLGCHIITDSYTLDNHFYLSTYWASALFFTYLCHPDDRIRVLQWNGRLLLGLCMLFATIWKLLSADYLDGSLFHFLFIGDDRFFDFARIFGGMSPEVSHARGQFLGQLLHPMTDPNLMPMTLRSPSGLRPLSLVVSWWTIIIEGTMALLFLLPLPPKLKKAPHLVLLLFAVATYPVAPVKGFGTLLMVMGYAQCGEEQKDLRLAYLGGIVFIMLCSLPVLTWL